MGAQSRFERLTGADLANLRAERPGSPWHFALVGVLADGRLTDRASDLRLDPVREWLASALPHVPRLRQVVHRTRPGQGRAVWVDAPEMDLDRHLRVAPVDPPGDRAAFVRGCMAVLTPPLDRSRPLWDLTVLPGLAGGQVGVVFRLHHAVADGVGAVALIDALCGGGDGTPAPVPVTPAAPSGRALAADAWRTRLAGMRGALHRPDVGGAITRVRALRAQLTTVRRPVPRTSLNRPLGPGRRLAILDLPRQALQQSAHQHGGTVNDAVLAGVAAALRRVLASRGEAHDLTLRASVPVSLRPAGAGGDTSGNRVGVLAVALPLWESDPRRALALIAAVTRQAKIRARRAGAVAATISTVAVRVAPWLLRRQRLVNVLVTNVPGPTEPIRLAGARLLHAYPATGLAGNMTLAVGVLSYAGDLGLGVVADADAWPDFEVFVEGLRDTLTTLAG